jgi:hypothetical protein
MRELDIRIVVWAGRTRRLELRLPAGAPACAHHILTRWLPRRPRHPSAEAGRAWAAGIDQILALAGRRGGDTVTTAIVERQVQPAVPPQPRPALRRVAVERPVIEAAPCSL